MITQGLDVIHQTSQMQESVSIAFLVLLEQLTPPERAAFLLHEVFEYNYAQIAKILGKNEANCRQLVRRARQQVTDRRPRFEASPEQHEKLLGEFLAATSSGDLRGLVALLSNEVVLYSDGGGKQRAALNPIHGFDHVARFLLGATKKTPSGITYRIEEVNGRPSIIYSTRQGSAGCLITFDIVEGLIRNIYVITNPEKLEHLS